MGMKAQNIKPPHTDKTAKSKCFKTDQGLPGNYFLSKTSTLFFHHSTNKLNKDKTLKGKHDFKTCLKTTPFSICFYHFLTLNAI